MTVNFYDTNVLIDAIETLPPFHTALADRYFPDGEVFTADNILVEYMDGDQMAAPFVAPRVNGITLAREGSTMESIVPGKVAVRSMTTEDDLKRRGFGEALGANLTPAARQAQLMARDLFKHKRALARRREAMAADMMFTGKIIMQEMADDSTVMDEKEVSFEIGTYVLDNYNWDTSRESGIRMIEDLDAMITAMYHKGLEVTEIVTSHEIGKIIQYNDYVMELRHNRAFSAFDNSKTTVLPNGLIKVCELDVMGTVIDVLTYRDTYLDPVTNIVKPFIPANYICLTAPGAGSFKYGAITQIDQGSTEFKTYANKEVPKMLADPFSDQRDIRTASRPICHPKKKGAFMVCQVTGNTITPPSSGS